MKTALEYVVNDIDIEKSNVIIIGDVNINMSTNDDDVTEFLDIYGMTNIVKTPTCFKNMYPIITEKSFIIDHIKNLMMINSMMI